MMSENTADLRVADDLVVNLEYTLRLDDGEIVDSSNGKEALAFIQGRGQIVRGLEEALYGMAIGEEKDVVVDPDDGYGRRNPTAVQSVDRRIFPPGLSLSSGMAIPVRDGSGRRFTGYVAEVAPDKVLLDFNHPLAGETLHFHVRVSGLREATSEELAPSCGAGCCSCASGSCH